MDTLISIFLSVQDWVADMIMALAEGFSFNSVLTLGKLGRENFIMSGDTWTTIGTLFDNVKGIGLALAATVFILNLIDLASRDNATFENFVKLILNVIFTISAINLAPMIVDIFVGINDNLLENLGAAKFYGGDSTENALDVTLGLVEALVALVIMILPFLVGLIADVAIYFPLISRCFEVAWRCVLFPIGVCNFTGGAQSPAMRYIKNLVATILVGVFYMIVIKIGATFSTAIMNDLAKDTGSVFMNESSLDAAESAFAAIGDIVRNALLLVVFKFATLGVMMSGSRVMKEVIG